MTLRPDDLRADTSQCLGTYCVCGGRGSNQCVFGKNCGFLSSANLSHEKRPETNSCQCYPVSLRKCNRSLAEACASRKCAGVGVGLFWLMR